MRQRSAAIVVARSAAAFGGRTSTPTTTRPHTFLCNSYYRDCTSLQQKSTCSLVKITLAPRSTSTEGSCERFMSTPPAPDYADAEPSLLPFRQRLSRLFPASHPVQIPQAGLFQDTINSSAEDLILRPKNQFFGRSRFQLCGTIKTSLHVPFL